jgi:hypothetical protein
MVNQIDSSPPAVSDLRPLSLTLALRLIVAMVLVGAVTVLLVIWRQDDLIRVWAEGNPATKGLLASHGLDAVKEGSVTPPRFVPVAITEYIVLAGLVGMLAVFLRYGYEWARISITVLLFFAAVASVAGFRVGQPGLFSIVTVILIVLFAALMVPLWHPATTAYLHRPLAEADPED